MSYTPQMPQAVASFSPEMYQSATAYRLGPLWTSYDVTMTGKRIIAGAILIVFGVVVGLVSTIRFIGAPISGSVLTALLGVLVGLLLCAVGSYLLLYHIIYKNWHVVAFEQGFLYKKGNEAPQPFRWDQIEAAWYHVTRHYRNGIYTGTTHRYRVRRQGGYEIILNDRFTNVGQLGDIISDQVTRYQLPQVMAAYNAGQTVSFGPLSIHWQGIMNGQGSLLPWQEIHDVEIQRGYVSVRKAGKWLSWSGQPVANIPNVFVFIAMTKSILRK